ncbi:E3 ubiquitin-protein ligase COP1 [Cryptomeria japonica]|uniref:E3 ubiquitin-protein ligase COP1 n=1 Tax=Cryptomeria japonica TaxID=3369 RepID=UPI0025ACC1C1|nr:E3 ubiquitin-protein ligase COP1 [Cryptomeria japonica]
MVGSVGDRLLSSVKAEALTVQEARSSDLNIEDNGNAEWLSQRSNLGHPGVKNLDIDKDFFCPICMQMIKDAFLTACGHSFCYTCIMTHLNDKKNCPCCGQYLTNEQLYPNFLLDKLLKKASVCQIASMASPTKHLRKTLEQGAEVSVKELDCLLTLLAEKKRKLEQEEAETNIEILLDFLQRLKQHKREVLNEIQADLQYIKEDISIVEKRRLELSRARERYTMKLRMILDNSTATSLGHPAPDNANIISAASFHSGHGSLTSGKLQLKSSEINVQSSSQDRPKRSSLCGSDSQVLPIPSGVTIARKRRVFAQFEDLQQCYLQKRRHVTCSLQKQLDSGFQKEKDGSSIVREGYHAGLEEFQSVLTTFTRYSCLQVIAELRNGDLFNNIDILSSIEFDRDDELFATAGVSRRIKVFEFASVVNEPADVHCPVVEMSSRSRLSCLSWNKYIKSHIASSDHEGIVTVWDVNTRQSIMEYEEHEKRAWSVDFSRTDPTMLVSGSDDCKVKVWCTRQDASVLTIDVKANICCVQCNPGSRNYIAVGSADRNIHYYDLRRISEPLYVFRGHRKAVSYIQFLSTNELASASIDSTLRLWDVKENCHVRTFKGHTNEKNFIGLTVNSEYIACGSETNEVFVYHKAISKAAACYNFDGPDLDNSDQKASHFISAVTWKSRSPTMLAANGQGTIKALVLAP